MVTTTGSNTHRPADGWVSSEVELRVECGDDIAPDEVCRVLDRALDGLATEVDQNFNVS